MQWPVHTGVAQCSFSEANEEPSHTMGRWTGEKAKDSRVYHELEERNTSLKHTHRFQLEYTLSSSEKTPTQLEAKVPEGDVGFC